MVETVEKRICDVCRKEVKNFAGSLELKYTDYDYTGCAFPVQIKRREICIDCCRKFSKIITNALEELENGTV